MPTDRRKRIVMLPFGGRAIIEEIPLSDAAQDAIEQGLAEELYREEHPDEDWPEPDEDEY